MVASLPDRDLTPAMAKERGDSYREDLDHLTDEQWLFAVGVAKRSLTFFPAIKHLLDFASEAPVKALPRPDNCEYCAGTGFEDVKMTHRADGTPHEYWAVRRCRCIPCHEPVPA